mgnify:CR=1 FL=1
MERLSTIKEDRRFRGGFMTDIQKLERLAYLADLPYCDHTSEDWDEQLRLECELEDHPKYISFLNS